MICAAYAGRVIVGACVGMRALFEAVTARFRPSPVFPHLMEKSMSKILSKADILGASDLATEQVEVPEWGGAVIIRSMTGIQRDAYENSLMAKGADGRYSVDTENMRVKLVLYCAVDEQGNQIFDASELSALAGKNAGIIERLFNAAQNLNGLNKGAVEDAAKNSVGDQPVSSVTA